MILSQSVQFLCSQSWLHLWLWHVFLWSNQLFIKILSFSYPRHPSNLSSSSSFYSHSSCKFTCLQQLDYCNSLYSGISQTNLNKILWHVSLQTLQNINTSQQHSKNYIGFLSNKESITKSVFSHTKHLQINNLHIFIVCSGSIMVTTLDCGSRGFWFESRLGANILWGSIDCTGLTRAFIPLG